VTLLALALLAPAAAAQRSLAIERFDAAVTVQRDASILVTETITARFTGSWNGIYRTIPVKYRTAQGFNWTLGFTLLEATDADGRRLRTETSRERHYVKVKIWVPGAQDATRTINLRYRATNGLRFFEDHDELYWNVTGDEWDVPIAAATAVIDLPAGASGVRAIAFNGVYGSTAQEATVEVRGTTVRLTMPHALGFHEGLTAVVGWDKRAVTAPAPGAAPGAVPGATAPPLIEQPTAIGRVAGLLRSNWPLAIPVPVFVLSFIIWRRRGRDPAARPVAVQYEPPAGLTPAEAGTLIDHAADMRDITATLVDLAVRGHLRIEEQDDRKLFGLIGGREYVLHRLTPEGGAEPLAPHERKVLHGLFSGRGSAVALSELEDEFYTELPGIRDHVFDRLLQHGYYRARPDRVRAVWMIGGVVLGLVIAIGGSALADALLLTPVPFAVAGILSAVTVVGFGLVMPARTEAGARTLEHVLGFLEFLRRVESEHLKRVIIGHPEMFDRYLPYAMAFGVEKKWARAFEGIYTEAPRWYVGTGLTTFSPSGFSQRLATMSSTVSTTMASSPRGSSGSGFGGGGSSGGGGGGGGGGGF
jgi:hypothetical protein